ncbi:MAG TPA: Mur ligase domain-containing protein, partial [Bacteroidales bacterium]|nr:Mur ligase domain-containing protein [Bacteroidales bacterium]
MFTYTIKQIADISNSVLHSKTPDAVVTNIHFDSRSFVQTPHALFLAIPGKNHNGHKYIADLYAQGCTLFWVEKGCEYPL